MTRSATGATAMTATTTATTTGVWQGRSGAGCRCGMVGRAAGMTACTTRPMLAAVTMVVATAKRCYVVARSPATIVDTKRIIIPGTGVTAVIVAVSAVGHDAAG